MPIVARFGNANPLHDVAAADTVHTTDVTFEEGISVDEAFVTMTAPSGVWTAQSADAAPLWVACSDPVLEGRLAAFYGASVEAVPGINA